MRLLEVLGEILDAGLIGDVQVVVFDLCESAVCLQCFGLLQLRVLFKLLQRGLAFGLVTGCKVDEKRAIAERRFGVLECKLAHDCKANALAMLDGFAAAMGKSTLFAPVTTPILL